MKSVGKPVSAPLQLERVLGISTLTNASFANSPSGDVFYSAGCVVVRYNPEENKQKMFYKASKPISSIAVSGAGRYLAIGERGHNATIIIYDVNKGDKLTVLSNHHKFGVGCLAFAPGTRYLVSVGFRHDKQLVLWDWDVGRKLSVQKLGNKVHAVSYHESGDYFVTAGDRHLKWWLVSEILGGEAVALEGKPASILEEQRHSVFLDVVCGSGSCSAYTFCTTSTGVLCMFNEERVMDKWVQLESPASFCLELFSAEGAAGLLAVGCANGLISCYSPLSLEYIAALPVPAPLSANQSATGATNTYPACYGLRKVFGTKASPVPKLSGIFADHSLFVWDISDVFSVAKYRSFLFHHSCVWDVQFVEDANSASGSAAASAALKAMSLSSKNKGAKLPAGSFVTCSTDNTVKVWNLDPHSQREYKNRSVYSREMLCSIDICEEEEDAIIRRLHAHSGGGITSSVNSTITSFALGGDGGVLDLSCAIPDAELPDRPKGNDAPRCLAVHPYGHELAVGSKEGRLRVIDLSTMTQKLSTHAHAAEILTMHYSPPLVSTDGGRNWSVNIESEDGLGNSVDEPMVLLATAGRDRLIHVFNASMRHSPIDTLDNHSSSVTIVRFTSDGKRLISCGGDKNMVFSSVNGPEIARLKSVTTPNGTINGLAVEASNKFAVTSGQDKRLNVWNVQSGKHMRAYKCDSITTELYKTDIDPSGMYIATCAFDKTVSIFDFFSGDLITQVTGHGEVVTGVRFSPDGQHLVTIGGDGCIMMWRLGESLVKAMQDRLSELLHAAQRKSNKGSVERPATTGSTANAPPPAPVQNSVMPPLPPTQEQQRPVTAASALSGINSKINKWGGKAEPGYELFGKKIEPNVGVSHRNQFTVELSETAAGDISVSEESAAHSSPVVSTKKALGSSMSPSRLANSMEEQDDVMLSALSDDEGGPSHVPDSDDDSDGSHLFTAHVDSSVDTTSHPVDDENEPITSANKAVDSLEKSAQHIESWLENVLHNDSKLDESISADHYQKRAVKRNALDISSSVAAPAAESEAADISSDNLNRSLSSAFFKSLRTSKTTDATDHHPHDPLVIDKSLPPAVAGADPVTAEEMKRRDRAAKVAQIKERMRLMNVEKARKAAEEAAAAAQGGAGDADEYADDTEPVSPPVPPSAVESSKNNKDKLPVRGNVDSDMDETNVVLGAQKRVVAGSSSGLTSPTTPNVEAIAQEIASKANSYRNILHELERAKQQAADSYQELMHLRSSLEESMSFTSPTSEGTSLKVQRGIRSHSSAAAGGGAGGGINLNQSMAETDQLLNMFRESFAQLSDTQRLGGGGVGSMSFNRSGNTFSGADSPEVSNILEKYSDRLLELVSDKIAAKFTGK